MLQSGLIYFILEILVSRDFIDLTIFFCEIKVTYIFVFVLKRTSTFIFLSFKKKYLSLERREGKEREREKHRLVASLVPPPEDLAGDPGLCPDWGLN